MVVIVIVVIMIVVIVMVIIVFVIIIVVVIVIIWVGICWCGYDGKRNNCCQCCFESVMFKYDVDILIGSICLKNKIKLYFR